MGGLRKTLVLVFGLAAVSGMGGMICSVAAADAASTEAADRRLDRFFERETRRIEEACLAGIRSIDDWQQARPRLQRELFEMFGLPAEGVAPATAEELSAVVTGRLAFEGDDGLGCTVEKVHFQSRPGLYVTANLYLPKDASAQQPCPGILYLCGHGRVVEDGVSLGNKVHYQHHGAWLAEHGYAVLMVDTLQLGEIEGIHHGTYREGRWWWPSRGYTPAGVEALNGLRGVDYLCSRPEVDADRIGVTGRSGGGAGSWWAATLDERVKVAVPVAGITDLRDHVVEGCVSGHCDCMFIVNTYRWDYPQLAALSYPRALLLANTDRDGIFPLDGVMRTQTQIRRLYELGGQPDGFGLAITSGGHADTQELQMPAIRWLDAHLGMGPRLIDSAARKRFEPKALKVFAELPADEHNTRIDREFVAKAGPFEPPADQAAWRTQADAWLEELRAKTFGGWPETAAPPAGSELGTREGHGLVERTYRIESQRDVELELIVLHQQGIGVPEAVVLEVLDQAGWERVQAAREQLFGGGAEDGLGEQAAEIQATLTEKPLAVAFFAPRGLGADRWNPDPKVHVQNRRRFLLLGQTWEGMQAYDIRRAMQAIRGALRQTPELAEVPLALAAEGEMAVLAVYASLFEEPVLQLELTAVPVSHDVPAEGEERAIAPSLLNVLRVLDVPQAVAMAAERSRVVIKDADAAGLRFVADTAAALQLPADRLTIESTIPEVSSTTVGFEEQVLDPEAGEVCYAVTLADVDGDADTDIVVVTEAAVIWYRNDSGDGTSWSTHDLTRGTTPRDNVCIAAHDIDGDGQVDFALGANWPREGTLHWLVRDGDPTRPWKLHGIGPLPSTHRMHWADVLGVGTPQLVVSPLNAVAGEPGVALTAYSIPDNPTTDRWLPTVLDRELNRIHGHLHTDLDGDGSIDTITASREGLHLVQAREGGGFGRALISAGAEAEEPNARGAGEVARGTLANGDDFLVAVEPMHGSAVSVLTRRGDGPADWERGVIDQGYCRGHALATADFDGDGADEIVFGSSDPSETPGHGPTLAVYARNASHSPLEAAGWRRQVLDAGGTTVEALAVGDVSGDGVPDVVAVGRATHNVKLFVAAPAAAKAR